MAAMYGIYGGRVVGAVRLVYGGIGLRRRCWLSCILCICSLCCSCSVCRVFSSSWCSPVFLLVLAQV